MFKELLDKGTIIDIKNKAWKDILKFNNLNDNQFDNSAISLKINENYNLVVWCDIECEQLYRYYIVSIRYNPTNDLFGEDIGVECSTDDITKKELEEAIDYVLNHKEFVKNIK